MLLVTTLAFYSLIVSCSLATTNHALKSWYSKVSDPKYECPNVTSDEVTSGQLFVKVISCDDPAAIFTYDYKVTWLKVNKLTKYKKKYFILAARR